MLPSTGRSQVVLIGASQFTDPELADLPPVRKNLTDLAKCLQDPELWGLPTENCLQVADPTSAAALVDPIHEAAERATDTLIVYYAGHGLVDYETNELLLALVATTPGRTHTAVPYEYVRRDLSQSRALRRVVILDCCYSGKVLSTMSAATSAADQASITGAYVLTSTPPNREALSPLGARYTAFTGELISVLATGIAGAGEFLTLDAIYNHLYHAARNKSLPEPQKRGGNTAGNLALVRNQLWRSGAGQPAPQPPEPRRPLVSPGGQFGSTSTGSTRVKDVAANIPGKRSRGIKSLIASGSIGLSTATFVTLVLTSPVDLRQLGLTSAESSSSTSASPSSSGAAPTPGDEGFSNSPRHSAGVKTVAFSPDGRFLASGGDDKTIILRTIHANEPKTITLTGHRGAIESIAFSPDSKVLVSASSDRTVRFWDTITGASIVRPTEIRHDSRVRTVAISPDGKLIATGGDDKTIRLWDFSSGRPLSQKFNHTATVKSVAFSPDNKRLASGSDDNSVRLWDVTSGQAISEPHHDHGDYVETVAFSPNGELLASGGDDSTVRLWNPITGTPVGKPFEGHQDYVRALTFSPNGRIIATASGDHTVRLWESTTGRPLDDPLIGHTTTVRCVAFSPDGKTLASGGMDNVVRLWTW